MRLPVVGYVGDADPGVQRLVGSLPGPDVSIVGELYLLHDVAIGIVGLRHGLAALDELTVVLGEVEDSSPVHL